MKPQTVFSPDKAGPDGLGRYRYTLHRDIPSLCDAHGYAMWIGLNPSTATAEKDDPTIRRIKGFTERFGCNGLMVCNLFAYRATEPSDMKAAAWPVGSDNDSWLTAVAEGARYIFCAWGTDGAHNGRAAEVCALLRKYKLRCLGYNNDGSPKHPLYVAGRAVPQPYPKP